jgi:hypothetical protein
MTALPKQGNQSRYGTKCRHIKNKSQIGFKVSAFRSRVIEAGKVPTAGT